MADRISAHRYYDGSDSCQASPRPAGLLAYLAHTSQRSASNHKGDPDIALHAISAYPMCFRLRPLLASSPSLPAESSSLSCGPPVRLQLLSTPPRSDAVTFGYRVLAYPDTDSHRAVCAPSRAHIGVEKDHRSSPPSEPCVRFSRTRLSSQWFPHRDWLARQAVSMVNSPRSAKNALGQR